MEKKKTHLKEKIKTVILSMLTGGMYLAVKMMKEEQKAKRKD